MTKSMMQRLHDSEINCSISCFFDSCWDWKLGDELNGWTAEGQERTFERAEVALAAAALKHFPQSAFALNDRPLKISDVQVGRFFRHIKTRGIYVVTDTTVMIEETWQEAVAYTQAGAGKNPDLKIVRPLKEFCDGRFEALPEGFGK